MSGTPTFELRTDGPNLRIVRVGVEYPPDATPDAPLPGRGEMALLELHAEGGIVYTDATFHGFDLPWPDTGRVVLMYRDGASRTVRVAVGRQGFGELRIASERYWPMVGVCVSRDNVRRWPSA